MPPASPRLVERPNLQIGPLLVDDDRSAFTGRPRPGYIQLCELIEHRTIDTVLAWHPDRLHGSPPGNASASSQWLALLLGYSLESTTTSSSL